MKNKKENISDKKDLNKSIIMGKKFYDICDVLELKLKQDIAEISNELDEKTINNFLNIVTKQVTSFKSWGYDRISK